VSTYSTLYSIVLDPLNAFGIGDYVCSFFEGKKAVVDPNQNLAWFTEPSEANKLKLIKYLTENEVY